MSGLKLNGLDGANPLGFLAALGVVNALADRGIDARLAWVDEGTWRPRLSGWDGGLDALVALLDADRVGCANDAALAIEYEGKRDLKPPPKDFRPVLIAARDIADAGNRRSIDWLAAFATDVAVDNNGNTKPTALHFTAGNQQFLKSAHELQAKVTVGDLREAVVGPWTYARELPIFGWDSTASREYALRASNPSTDKKLGVPGADWLALRGLSFISVVPSRDRVLTTGCSGEWKSGRFRWPLWTVPIQRSVIATLVGLRLDEMKVAERTARGIGAVFACGIRRHDNGGYGSFTPSALV